jgi:hypothetical protein
MELKTPTVKYPGYKFKRANKKGWPRVKKYIMCMKNREEISWKCFIYEIFYAASSYIAAILN